MAGDGIPTFLFSKVELFSDDECKPYVYINYIFRLPELYHYSILKLKHGVPHYSMKRIYALRKKKLKVDIKNINTL